MQILAVILEQGLLTDAWDAYLEGDRTRAINGESRSISEAWWGLYWAFAIAYYISWLRSLEKARGIDFLMLGLGALAWPVVWIVMFLIALSGEEE